MLYDGGDYVEGDVLVGNWGKRLGKYEGRESRSFKGLEVD